MTCRREYGENRGGDLALFPIKYNRPRPSVKGIVPSNGNYRLNNQGITAGNETISKCPTIFIRFKPKGYVSAARKGIVQNRHTCPLIQSSATLCTVMKSVSGFCEAGNNAAKAAHGWVSPPRLQPSRPGSEPLVLQPFDQTGLLQFRQGFVDGGDQSRIGQPPRHAILFVR